MKNVIISTKTLLLAPILFVIIFLIRIGADYYDSQNKMYDFAQKQSQVLNAFMIVHRNYYQNLYLNGTLPLNEKSLLGLPAFSAFEISKQFSERNSFDMSIQTVSDRARNEKNRADESEKKAIDYFNADKTKKEYFVDEGEFYQFASPLFVEQKCLACHGKKEDAPEFISKRYDTAYDYQLGELRGIVSLKVPKSKISDYFFSSFLKELLFDAFIATLIILITFYFVKYFRNLAQNLEIDVQEKTKELVKNIAYLNSYKLAIDESSIVSKSDLSGKITYVNDNFCKISGYRREEVLGKSHNLLRHPDNKKETFDDMWKTIAAKKPWKGVLQNRGKENDYWVDIVILPILDEEQNIVEYIAVRHDITKIVEQKQKLKSIANTDALTGFANRYKLNNDIKESKNPAIAVINIDDFSQINDFYGHQVGDDIIRQFGQELQKRIDEKLCTIYHLQGDEYVVFNKNVQKELFLLKIASLVDEITKHPFVIYDEKIKLNVTAALSFEDKEKILITADMALKVARQEKKNILVYSEKISLNKQYEENIKWTKKLKKALEEDKIIPVFQPIINNSNGKWEKYEALVRLEEDEKLFSPFFFLDIAKKTKHYTQLTMVMIKKSFDKFKDKDVEFSINLTVEDILNSDIKVYIYGMLEEYKIGERVVFEIVESESILDFEEILEFIKNVKSHGVKIAIDDFGTGYSNFEYLLKLKADYIKIDASMIKNIDTDGDVKAVVSIIVDFAQRMGIKTVAEFVENESIFKTVKELGIDYSQGYYFSQPKVDIS